MKENDLKQGMKKCSNNLYYRTHKNKNKKICREIYKERKLRSYREEIKIYCATETP